MCGKFNNNNNNDNDNVDNNDNVYDNDADDLDKLTCILPKTIKKAVIYCRVSSSASNYNIMSIDMQKNICNNFCKNKLPVIDVVSEVMSAKNMTKMKKLSALLRSITPGTLLVVADVSRFTRNFNEGLTILQSLIKKDCTVYAVNNGCYYDENNLINKNKIHRLMRQSESESKIASFRAKQSIMYRKKLGCKIGRCKYGYETYRDKNGKLREKINKEEKDIIFRIIDYHKKGDSLKNIAEKLNNNNILYKNKKKWNYSKIYTILKTNR